jgi:hypothetical protein
LLLGIEPEPESELARLIVLDTRGRVQREREDLLGRVVRDLLDVHAARGGRHDRDPLGAAVDDEAQVQLAVDARARLDVDPIDREPLVPALVRNEPRAEQRLRVLLDLRGGFRELHAAGLAAATRVDLSLDDPDAAAELLGGGFRLGRGFHSDAFGNGNAVLGEQCLRLVFVEIHTEIM